MHKFLVYLLVCGLAGSVLTCTDMNLAGGGLDTETSGGTVVGSIVDSVGHDMGGIQIRLFPMQYNPVTDGSLPASLVDTTGEDGSYSFHGIGPGSYNVVAVHPGERTSAMASQVLVDNDTATVRLVTMEKAGAILIMMPEAVDTENGYLYIPGTAISVLVRSRKSTLIDSVPAGTIPAVNYMEKTALAPTLLHREIMVFPGDTTVCMPLWDYSRRLYLNTSASGAAVFGNVNGFPVLVRLTSGNFSFDQAKNGGEDLRFAKADGTPLPYEIERWDAAGQRAEIWVRVDTVFGDNSLQSITMYWGNPVATGASNSAVVFDTAAGFQGVWHLAATGDTAPDATGNGYDGSGYYTSPVKGIIGNAQQFNGTSSYIRIEGTAPESRLNFPMDGRYSVSAWVYHDTLIDSATYLIAGKGELQYFLKTFGLAQSTPNHVHQWEFTEYHENDNWRGVTYTPAAAGTWNYLVGVKDGPDQFLYVNGVLVMAEYRMFGTGQVLIPRDTTDDFSIGAFLRNVDVWDQGYAFFNGAIDEVGVASTPRSADWIKLCYMNQKAQDALVQW